MAYDPDKRWLLLYGGVRRPALVQSLVVEASHGQVDGRSCHIARPLSEAVKTAMLASAVDRPGQSRGARDTRAGHMSSSVSATARRLRLAIRRSAYVDLAALGAVLPGGVSVVGSHRQRYHGRNHGKANEASLKPTVASRGMAQTPMSECPCHCWHPHDSHQRRPTGEWIHRHDEDHGPEPPACHARVRAHAVCRTRQCRRWPMGFTIPERRGRPSRPATFDHATGPEHTFGAVAVSCNGALADWTVSGQDNEDGIAS